MGKEWGFFGESFENIRQTQEGLLRFGWYLFDVPKEHTEGLVTQPLVQRIRTQIKKRGFEKLAGRSLITFNGYADDPREVFLIPEIRGYWRRLDAELPELPALLGMLPQLRYNGPGLYLTHLGEVDLMLPSADPLVYDVHVVGGEKLIAQALHRISQAARKYHLNPALTERLIRQFLEGAGRL